MLWRENNGTSRVDSNSEERMAALEKAQTCEGGRGQILEHN